MEITLKNLKVARFMSEETLCYQATVYVDGKKAGTVSNEGHGGCSSIHLNPEYNHLHKMQFSVDCGCNKEHDCILCKGTGKYDVSIDDYCDHIANKMDNDKERTKHMNKYRKQGFKFMIDFKGGYMAVMSPDEATALALVAKKYPTYTVTSITAL